jgi:hypothetical protein
MPRFGFGGEEQLLALDLASRGWQLAYVDGVVAHHHPSARSASRELRPASEIRNELWSAWLRRRPRTALSTTLAVGRQSVRGGQTAALIEALRGLPWALSRRRRLPGDVEAAVELLA